MPIISMYLHPDDLPVLAKFLAAETEITMFVLAKGLLTPFDDLTLEPNGDYYLWHIPCGEIPNNCRDSGGNIFVGPLSLEPGAISLRLEAKPGKYQQILPGGMETPVDPEAIGRSDFIWVGNKFSAIGTKAHPLTEKWWRHLKRWITRNATKITWFGPLDGPALDQRNWAWAFPIAYAAIKGGRARSCNPVLVKTFKSCP